MDIQVAEIRERVAAMEATLRMHTTEDARRFDEVKASVNVIGEDIKILLQRTAHPRPRWNWKQMASTFTAAAAFSEFLRYWLHR